MSNKILIRFGDLMLKGKNIGFFIKRIHTHVRNRLSHFDVQFDFKHDRIFVDYLKQDEEGIFAILKNIQGIYSFSVVYACEPNLESIIKTGQLVLDTEATTPMITIKIESKRVDKTFPYTSQELSKVASGPILAGAKLRYIVDVHHPQETLRIEVHKRETYLYLKEIKGLGGYPFGTGGKAMLMLSGGIDSPVAGYLAMKQGLELELIHFESTPMTPIESAQKVVELAQKLSIFTINQTITLHFVPFYDIHKMIIDHVFDPYIITVMRRMMYRIAEKFSRRRKALAIINGESIGQVASQTLQSISVVESVTKMPILRPLVTMDKLKIIELAKQIDTYNLSIKPHQDCCSIYIPKSPVTKPMEVYAKKYEESIDYLPYVERAFRSIQTIEISNRNLPHLERYGFSVSEAIEQYEKERVSTDDYLETKR